MEGKEKKAIVKKVLPKCPNIYADGDINMHSSMIVDEQSFCALWKGSSRQDLKKAYAKAKKWREQFS